MSESFLESLREFAFPKDGMKNIRESMREQMGMPDGAPPSNNLTPGTSRGAPLTAAQELEMGVRKDAPVVPDPTPSEILQGSLAHLQQADRDPNILALTTLSRDRGNSLTRDNVILEDRKKLSPFAFQEKYGEDVNNMMARIDVGGGRVRAWADQDRVGHERAGDNLVNVGSGFVQGAGSLATLGAGLVADELGVAFSEGMDKIGEATRGIQSRALNRHRRVDSMRAELDRQDSAEQHEKDVIKDGDFLAGLKQIGRGISKGLDRLGEDPMMLETGTAEGVGSMLVGGPGGKLVAKAGQGIAALGAKETGTLIAKQAFPLAVGAMEGGGAYSQAANEVMNTDHEVLMAQSPEYRALIASGMSGLDAKTEFAGTAGLTAAAVAAPVGAVTGKLVEGFEKAPLRNLLNAPKKAFDNAKREGVEEFIQSGTGEFASNLGVQTSGADPNKNLTENVGDTAIQGSVFGIAGAGLQQAPGAILQTGAAGAKAVGKVLMERANALRAENQAGSSVSEENVRAGFDASRAAMPNTTAAIRDLMEQNKDKLKAKDAPELEVYLNDLEMAHESSEKDFAHLPEDVKATLRQEDGSYLNRFEAAQQMAKLVMDENAPAEARVGASIYIQNMYNTVKKLASPDNTPEFIKGLVHNNPDMKSLQDFKDVFNTIYQTPAFKQAREWAQKGLPAEMAKVDPLKIETSPEGQKILDSVLSVAETAPQAMNEDLLKGVLKQDSDNKITLTPEQRRLLQGASYLMRAGKSAEQIYDNLDVQNVDPETGEKAPAANGIDYVNKQIETVGGDRQHQMSMKDHVDSINTAEATGDFQTHKRAVARLGQFARSMHNKLDAINKAIVEGNLPDNKGQYYQALGPNGWLPDDKKNRVYFNRNKQGEASPESIRMARTVHAETTALTNLANDYVKANPKFGFNELPLPVLNLGANNEIIATPPVTRGSSTTETKATSPQAQPKAKKPKAERDADDRQLELPLETPAATPQAPSTTPAEVTTDPAPEAAITQPRSVKDQVTRQQEAERLYRQERDGTEEPAEGAAETAGDQSSVSNETTTDDAAVSEPGTRGTQDKETADVSKEIAPPETEKLSDAFPNLLTVNGPNWFHAAYRLPKFGKQIAKMLLNPLGNLSYLFNNPQKLIEFMGNDYDEYTLHTQDALGVIETGKVMRKLLDKRLKKALAERRMQERIANGEAVLSFKDALALNITEALKGGINYNTQLIETAILAGLDWAINTTGNPIKLDKEEVAKVMGVDISQVTSGDEFALNKGLSLSHAKKALGEHILQFWGVQFNRNLSDSYVRGVVESVASEVLAVMADPSIGLIKLGEHKTKQPNGQFDQDGLPQHDYRIYPRVWFDERSEDTNASIRNMAKSSTFLADTILEEKQRNGPLFAPAKKTSPTQLRNPLVRNSKTVQKAQAHEQETPFKINFMFFNFMMSLDEDTFVESAGGSLGDIKNLNAQHAKSVDGKNRGLRATYHDMQKQVDKIKEYAKINNLNVNEVKVYFKYDVSRVGRLQMVGDSSPQSNKWAREILMPTEAILDMTSEVDQDRFWLTVAQGLGEKTEYVTRKDARANAEALIAGQYAEVIEGLKTWMAAHEKDSTATIPAVIINAMKTKGELVPHKTHSLLAVANYQRQLKNNPEGLSKYKHFNYIEADGKTNGPINALMLMATGAFNGDWLRLVAKGGAFVGGVSKTLNQHYLKDKADLYQTVADLLQIKQRNYIDNLEETNPEMHAHAMGFRRLLSALNMDDFKFDPASGELTIYRGGTKSPLTISIYGSGVDGIAGNFANAMIDELYERMSILVDAKQGMEGLGALIYPGSESQKFDQDFKAMFTQIQKKSGEVSKPITPALTDFNQAMKHPRSFEVSPKMFEIFRKNVRVMFVNQLKEAIDEGVMGQIAAPIKALQKATQLQSVILKELFKQMVVEIIANKKANPEQYPDYTPGNALSQNEVSELLEKLKPYSPLINTGSQSFFMAGGETSNMFEKVKVDLGGDELVSITLPKSFGYSLMGDMASPAYIYGPTHAGVRGVPSVIIGTGDGEMMLQAALLGVRGLGTFDGRSLSADKMDEYGRLMNEAVFKSWDQNPLRAVAKSFQDFVRNNPTARLANQSNPLNVVYKDFVREASKTLLVRSTVSEGNTLDPDEIMEGMEALAKELNSMADSIDARRQVMREFGISVDQMASTESPYVLKGSRSFAEGATDDQKAAAMTDRYNELMRQKLLEQSQEQQTAVEAPNSAFREAVESATEIDLDHGVRVLSGAGLRTALLAVKDGLSAAQIEMVELASNVIAGTGYKIVFGNWADLDSYDQAHNAERYDPKGNNGYGKIDTVSKLIYINNMAPETVIHELIHAATLHKIIAAYDSPEVLSAEDLAAIKRLELLMDEWLDQNLNTDNDAARDAYDHAAGKIDQLKREGKIAEAVAEFTAWVMANKPLAEVAAKTLVKNPLAVIIGKAYAVLKTLIWGANNKIPAKLQDNLLSQLQFNTRVLMSTPSLIDGIIADASINAMHQSASFGSSNYLTELTIQMHRKVQAWVKEVKDPGVQVTRNADRALALKRAHDVTKTFMIQGLFQMTPQEQVAFRMVNLALFTETSLDGNALSEIQNAYDHVISELKWQDFKENPLPDQADDHQALQRFNALNGNFGGPIDAQGRSALLSSFLALAMTNAQFRDILTRMKMPARQKDLSGTFDARLTNLGNQAMDSLNRRMSGNPQDANVRDALDALNTQLIADIADTRTLIERTSGDGMDRVENYLSSGMQRLTDVVDTKLHTIIKTSTNKAVKGAARAVRAVNALINEKSADAVQQAVTQALNQNDGMEGLRNLVSEIRGRTKDNAPLFDMISLVRSTVQQLRQQFRELLPKKLASKFSRKLTKLEKSALHMAFARTDLAALRQNRTIAQILDLISDDNRIQREVTRLEAAIQQADPRRAAKMLTKAQQLANHMVTGETGVMLASNAYAVAHLVGERGQIRPDTADQGLVDNLDQLITLYAMQKLEASTKTTLEELLNTERDGLDFTLSYLVGLRQGETNKLSHTTSQVNHYKGYTPATPQQGVSLIVANDSEHAKLVSMGYTKLRDYHGSAADTGMWRKSYYFAPVSGRAVFNQGVMQTVHQTVNGIDPNTGFTVGELTAGRITDPATVQQILRSLRNVGSTSENLKPIYNERFQVVALERSIDPVMASHLNRDTDLLTQMGVWQGRQVEEALGQEFNTAMVGNLHDIWLAKKGRHANEFINIEKVTDPVIKEAWRLAPDSIKRDVKAIFGSDGFMVRRDMIPDAVGFRQASVGDLFTGNTRWSKTTQDRFQDIAMGIFGNKAYAKLVKSEQIAQDLVTNAKVLIVVKSVVVPTANLIANIYQLMSRDVPVRDIVTGLGKKTGELNNYIKWRAQEIDLDAELKAAKGANNNVQIRKLENRIQSLHDGYRRLTIWPLIEAGEFSAISNGSVTVEDLAIANGQWGNWSERLAEKIPAGIRTPFKYALVTRDTALFQGLARAVQYGDFLGKAVLYDHLTKRKGLSKAEALAKVGEEFVNYNRLAGRSRNYLESIGMLWFWNYKLRIMKIGAQMIRERPLTALLMAGLAPNVPLIGNIGLPTTDNFLSVMADGRLGHSIGPGQGLNAFHLNPVMNIIN